MKGIETALKVKKREFLEEEGKLKELLLQLEELKVKELETQKRVELLKKLKVNTTLEFAFLKETVSTLLKTLERIGEEIITLSEKVEKQKEKVALKRGEIKACLLYTSPSPRD